MPEQSHQIHQALSCEERKQLLVQLCSADRAAWRQACQPTHKPGTQLLRALGYLEPFSKFLPGRLGRWLSGANFLTRIVRQFGWLRL